MTEKADLHIHSEFSLDGEYTVKAIVEKCMANNVDVFTISDHNFVDGNTEAAELAKQHNLHFIPGVEIDCNFNGTDLHLLGLNINWKSNDFLALEKEYSRLIMDSFAEMVHNLDKLGIKVDIDEVMEKANGKLPSGELIAETLLTNDKYQYKQLEPYRKGGTRGDMPYVYFYFDFFSQGSPAYVKVDYMSFKDAVDLVRSNEGTPIVAHPGHNFKGNEETVAALLDHGAQGLEVFNNYHNDKEIEYYAELAIAKKGLMTCGSDFHGKTKPVIDIGNYAMNEKYRDYLSQSLAQFIRP